jgi:hypothetical protein
LAQPNSDANKNDWLTVAAIGLAASCIVTFDHEALGHGSACLALGGHIRLLTSSIFRCDVRSGWIDPAGPFANLLMGTVALLCTRFVPRRKTAFRLLLMLITAFSYFWESGYVMRAMHRRDGDLYFFAQYLLGDVTVWERWLFAAAGLALFFLTIRITANALLDLWPKASRAHAVARIAWLGAIVGDALAALAYRGHSWSNFRDAVLEVGAASFPLLLIPRRSRGFDDGEPAVFVKRSPLVLFLCLLVYAIFVATLGRGIVS